MPATISDMTPEDFGRLLETVVERKLRDVLGLAGDETLDPALVTCLADQRAAVAGGDRGVSLAEHQIIEPASS